MITAQQANELYDAFKFDNGALNQFYLQIAIAATHGNKYCIVNVPPNIKGDDLTELEQKGYKIFMASEYQFQITW